MEEKFWNEKDLLFLVWPAIISVWRSFAPRFTPLVRNAISLLTILAAFILACISPYDWKLTLGIWAIVVVTFLSWDRNSINSREHFYRRQRVTFLQDLFVMAGSLLVVFEIILLIY